MGCNQDLGLASKGLLSRRKTRENGIDDKRPWFSTSKITMYLWVFFSRVGRRGAPGPRWYHCMERGICVLSNRHAAPVTLMKPDPLWSPGSWPMCCPSTFFQGVITLRACLPVWPQTWLMMSSLLLSRYRSPAYHLHSQVYWALTIVCVLDTVLSTEDLMWTKQLQTE